MIAKSKTNTNLVGTLNYVSKERANGTELVYYNNIEPSPENRDIYMQMKTLQDSYKGRAKQKTMHHIISINPKDNDKINSEILQKICSDYIGKMNLNKMQSVAYIHRDKEHLHLHIVSNLVERANQRKIEYKTSFCGRKSKSIATELSKKYNLTNEVEVGRKRRAKIERQEEIKSLKIEDNTNTMNEHITGYKEACKKDIEDVLKQNPKELNSYFSVLEDKGYTIKKHYQKDTDILRGYSLEKGNSIIQAGDIDNRKYTISNLEKKFNIINNIKQATQTLPAKEITEFTAEQINFAKSISIAEYLAQQGYQYNGKGKDLFFILQGEKTGHTHIDTEKNLWYDFNNTKGGDIISLLQQQENKNFVEAVKHLLEYSNNSQHYEKQIQKPIPISTQLATPQNRDIQNTKKQKYINNLNEYAKSRGISAETIQRTGIEYLSETKNGKEYYYLGCKNESGGYALRNKYIKGNTGETDISIITGNTLKPMIIVEGQFEALTLKEQQIDNPILILNSITNKDKAINYINEQKKPVILALNNDTAGFTTTTEISQKISTNHEIYKYPKNSQNKDLNSVYIDNPTQNNIKSDFGALEAKISQYIHKDKLHNSLGM